MKAISYRGIVSAVPINDYLFRMKRTYAKFQIDNSKTAGLLRVLNEHKVDARKLHEINPRTLLSLSCA